MYQNLVTVEWIQARDTLGLISDSTSLDDSILRVSMEICSRVGHDFGDSTAVEETLFGEKTSILRLYGKTKYPLSSADTIYIDTWPLTLATDVLYERNIHIGNLITAIHAKYTTWHGFQVMIAGDWGWSAIPDDVMEAAYRLLVLEITGKPYMTRRTNENAGYGSNPIKRIKHPDGVEIEYAANASSSIAYSSDTTGDSYADSVIRKYRWSQGGGVV